MKKIILILTLILSSFSVPSYALEMTELKTKLPDDHVLGKDDAPITLIEYASLSCSHCANFHVNVLPLIKKDFIDAGQVRLIFRDFPLNASAFTGSELAICAGNEGSDKYFTAVNILFEAQKDWAFEENFQDKALDILKAKGFDRSGLEACIKNNSTENEIKESSQGARKWKCSPPLLFS